MAQNSHSIGNLRDVTTIVVARFSAIGDVAMTVPVLYSACADHPEIHFIFVTRRTMTDIFVNAPSNLTLVGVDLKTDYVGVAGMWRLVSELARNYDIDFFADFHGVLRTRMMRIFFKLKGIPSVGINKGKACKRALTRRHRKQMVELRSQRARYCDVFTNAGLSLSDRFEGLFEGSGSADQAKFAPITVPKNANEKWLGVAPFAAHKGKIYPIEKMEEILSLVRKANPEVRFFFFGGGGEERETLERWAELFGNSVSLAGKKYGFPVELALMNHLDAMVTMDSSNMHLAAIALTPTVSIWGATHPYCGFKGWNQPDDNMIQLSLECRPCSVFGNKPCYRGDYKCLSEISPETVAKKILEKLS